MNQGNPETHKPIRVNGMPVLGSPSYADCKCEREKDEACLHRGGLSWQKHE